MCYMISRSGGAAPEPAFFRALEPDVFTLVELTKPDLPRVAALVERYVDFPLGAVNASVVAVAERLDDVLLRVYRDASTANRRSPIGGLITPWRRDSAPSPGVKGPPPIPQSSAV